MDRFLFYTPNQIAQVVLAGVMGLQQIRNVFYFAFESFDLTPGDPDDVVAILNALAADIMEGDLLDNLILFTADAMVYQSAEAAASDEAMVFSPGLRGYDFFTRTGAAAEDALPTYDAISFRTNSVSPSFIRSGYKRFAGVPESCQDDGYTSLTAGALTAAALVRDWMEEDHVLPVDGLADQTYHMVIPKTDLNAETGKYQIRGGYLVDTAGIQPQIKTQASRKIGVGI